MLETICANAEDHVSVHDSGINFNIEVAFKHLALVFSNVRTVFVQPRDSLCGRQRGEML